MKGHPECVYHIQGEPVFRFININEGEDYCLQPGLGRLVVLLKGKINFSYSVYNGQPMRRKQMVFLPVGYAITLSAKELSCLLVVRLENKIHFCDCFHLETLTSHIRSQKIAAAGLASPYLINTNIVLINLIRQVESVVASGYSCRLYFNSKTQELLMLLRVYYSKDQLGFFFREILNAESQFAYKVVHNYHRFLTFSELAAFMGMSLNTFERRFRHIFSQSGYKWMNERRKQKIFHAITTNSENFKELSVQFGFSSPAAFNRYCKTHLGSTPGLIRQYAKTGKK